MLAAHEAGLGVSSTYYFLWDGAPDYNVDDGEFLARLIEGMGHRVGDHFDWAWITRALNEDRRQNRFSDREPLSGRFPAGYPVSVHCPPPEALWVPLPHVEYAYAPEWEGRYYADSTGAFRYGDPEDHPGPWPIQLNLHPEWWMPALLGADHPIAVYATEQARKIAADVAALAQP